jgi:hypothetical protein
MTIEQSYINYFGTERGLAIYDAQKRANPTIITDTTTCGQLRAASATAMATTTPLATVLAGKTQVYKSLPVLHQTTASAPTVNTTNTPSGQTSQTAADRISATRDCDVQQAAATQQKASCTTAPKPSPKTTSPSITVTPTPGNISALVPNVAVGTI